MGSGVVFNLIISRKRIGNIRDKIPLVNYTIFCIPLSVNNNNSSPDTQRAVFLRRLELQIEVI